MLKQPTRNDLARAIEKFMQLPFPERSADDTADQLHADLLLFDSAAGEAVMTVANGARVPREDLFDNRELRQQLEELAASDAPGAADARIYLDYLTQLEQVLALAREVIKRHKKR